jgi:hypothetical protein
MISSREPVPLAKRCAQSRCVGSEIHHVLNARTRRVPRIVARAALGEPSFQLHASSSSAMAAARPASMPTAVSQSDRPAAATAYSPHPDGSARTSVAKAGVTPVLSSPEVRTATASIHPDWLRMRGRDQHADHRGTDPAAGHLAEQGNRGRAARCRQESAPPPPRSPRSGNR